MTARADYQTSGDMKIENDGVISGSVTVGGLQKAPPPSRGEVSRDDFRRFHGIST